MRLIQYIEWPFTFFVQNFSTEDNQITDKDDLKRVTFNCKNVNGSDLAVEELLPHAHMILIQEHWLF